MYAVKKKQLSEFVMFGGNCGYICFIYALSVAYNVGSCVDSKSICLCRIPNILHLRMA
jgi:hypothetical protein